MPHQDQLEKCKNCGGKISYDAGFPTLWKHLGGFSAPRCNNGEPGMGLSETIQEYWKNSSSYAPWAHGKVVVEPKVFEPDTYTMNAVLHGLQFQATFHWNNCNNTVCKHCVTNGKDTADRYMQDLINGRHDLHPWADQDVHMIAFEIHNASEHGKGHEGIMTCTYVRGAGQDRRCNCYEQGYQVWLQRQAQKAEQVIIAATVIDPDDAYYSPRFV